MCEQRSPVLRRQVGCNYVCLWVAVQDRLAQFLAEAAAHILRHSAGTTTFLYVLALPYVASWAHKAGMQT